MSAYNNNNIILLSRTVGEKSVVRTDGCGGRAGEREDACAYVKKKNYTILVMRVIGIRYIPNRYTRSPPFKPARTDPHAHRHHTHVQHIRETRTHTDTHHTFIIGMDYSYKP